MMTTPIFSIVMTTYNRADLLGRALASILTQNFADFELLIIDDASTDQTSEVITAFTDARLRPIKLSENRGVGHARNAGIDLAAGEYIVFVDDDDTIAPSFLTQVYAAFSQSPNNVGFLWTWKHLVRQSATGLDYVKLFTFNITSSEPLPGHHYLNNIAGGSGGLAVRTTALRAVGGFNPEFRAAGDTELLIRLAKRFDFIVIPEALYTIFQHPAGRLTTNNLWRARQVERILEIHFDDFKKYSRSLNDWYHTIGKQYYRCGDRRSGRKYILKLIRNQPRKWQYWILLLMLENLAYLPAFAYQRILPTDQR